MIRTFFGAWNSHGVCSGFQMSWFRDQNLALRIWVSAFVAEIRGFRLAHRSSERVDDCRRDMDGCYIIWGRNVEFCVRARLAQTVVHVLKPNVPRLQCSSPRRSAVVEVIEIGPHLHRGQKSHSQCIHKQIRADYNTDFLR